ncbi:MAG: CPBP family intramembrane metalloprotease [Candidatus Omnitrophica bacterium]|nr:CPBP family intramembrane metalloprotease [Candidatus Omnitrophota bacterium]
MQKLFFIFKYIFGEAAVFFRQEKTTAFLLLLVAAIYGSANLFQHEPAKNEKPSEAMQKIEAAEKIMKEKQSSGELQAFLKENAGPFELVLLVFVPLLLAGMFAGGLLVDVLFIKSRIEKKEWIIAEVDKGWSSPGEPCLNVMNISWGVTAVIKTVIWVLLAGILISFAMIALRKVLALDKETSRNLFLLGHTIFLDFAALLILFYQAGPGTHVAENFSALGLRFSQFWQDVRLGLVSYLAVFPLVILVMMAVLGVCYLVGYEPEAHPLVEIFVEEDYKNPLLIYLSIFLACTAGPVIEELFFRGFCFPAFKKKWGLAWGMILSSAFFAVIHNSIFAFFPIFTLGMAFAYVYEKRKSLMPAIVMHMTHNTIFIGYFFILKRVVLDAL